MRVLLDTHCWLWMQASPERFSTEARRLLEDPRNDLYLSAASAWEIVVKWSVGKLPLPLEPRSYLPSRLAQQGVRTLPIELRHTLRVASLPLLHRDPFDRVLLAQALCESLLLLSADRQLAAYEDVELLWAR